LGRRGGESGFFFCLFWGSEVEESSLRSSVARFVLASLRSTLFSKRTEISHSRLFFVLFASNRYCGAQNLSRRVASRQDPGERVRTRGRKMGKKKGKKKKTARFALVRSLAFFSLSASLFFSVFPRAVSSSPPRKEPKSSRVEREMKKRAGKGVCGGSKQKRRRPKKEEGEDGKRAVFSLPRSYLSRETTTHLRDGPREREADAVELLEREREGENGLWKRREKRKERCFSPSSPERAREQRRKKK
jgi:hypothetical protein